MSQLCSSAIFLALLGPHLGTQSLVMGSKTKRDRFYLAGNPLSSLNFSHLVKGFSLGIGFSLGTMILGSGKFTL